MYHARLWVGPHLPRDDVSEWWRGEGHVVKQRVEVAHRMEQPVAPQQTLHQHARLATQHRPNSTHAQREQIIILRRQQPPPDATACLAVPLVYLSTKKEKVSCQVSKPTLCVPVGPPPDLRPDR